MTGCILWEGRVSAQGYGLNGKRLAHREAWTEANGEIPKGMVVHHRCEVKLCVNPTHLECMTHTQHNRLHMNAAPLYERRRAITHCPRQHEYTPENTLVKRGKRHCRACENQRSREYHAKHRERLNARMRERARERRGEQGSAHAWVRNGR